MFTIFGGVQAIGPSGLFGWSIEGGFGERLEKGPQEVGHVCCVGVDTGEIGLLGIRCQIYAVGRFVGGFVFLEGGFAKRGNPPPGYGPVSRITRKRARVDMINEDGS